MDFVHTRQKEKTWQIQDEKGRLKEGKADTIFQAHEREVTDMTTGEQILTFTTLLVLFAIAIAGHRDYMKNYTDEFARTNSD